MVVRDHQLYFKINFKQNKIFIYTIKNKNFILLCEIQKKHVDYFWKKNYETISSKGQGLTQEQKLLVYLKYWLYF